MKLFDKSVLKPEGSIMAGLAVAGSVFMIYSNTVGPVSSVQMSAANDQGLETSRKKAAYTAFLFVSSLTLLTKDMSVGTLGYSSIIAEEIHYRHAIMSDPATGIMQPPAETTYTPAENVVPLNAQGYAVG